MMKNNKNIRLSNTHADKVVFTLYHLLLIIVTPLFIFIFTNNLNFMDVEGIKEALVTKYESMPDDSKINPPRLTLIRGEVYITRANEPAKLAVVNDLIMRGDAIETKEKSGALLEFGKSYKCQVRLGPNTVFNVDDFLTKNRNDSVENSFFFLVKGVISVLLHNNGTKVNVGIKTHVASFGVRGTNFVVHVDQMDNTLLAVKEGKVEAQSFASMNNFMVESGSSLIATKDKGDKVIASTDIINKYDWDMDSLEKNLSTDDQIDTKIVELAHAAAMPKEDVGEKKSTQETIANLKKNLEEELITFKSYNEYLKKIIIKSDIDLKESELRLQKEQSNVEADIECLSKSKDACSLNSEDILLRRGWPNSFGHPKYRSSIVVDLKKYLKELSDKIHKASEDKAIVEDFLQRRKQVLDEVESKLSDENELQNNLHKLQDVKLLYKLKEH